MGLPLPNYRKDIMYYSTNTLALHRLSEEERKQLKFAVRDFAPSGEEHTKNMCISFNAGYTIDTNIYLSKEDAVLLAHKIIAFVSANPAPQEEVSNV